MFLGFKYTIYVWAIVGFSVVGYWCVQQEWLERKYPTPHEWNFVTRLRFRLAKWAPDRTDSPHTDWVLTGNYAKDVLARLEDPKGDGAGLQQQRANGRTGYDITTKSEPWKRGYYEALMLCAKAAENLDDHVVDTTRHLVFPADQILGPSNPHPKPIAHGSPSAPHEKDCEPAFESPRGIYEKILTTEGFSSKQKMDAALEYASWLEFKDAPSESAAMYETALKMATEAAVGSSPSAPLPYDEHSFVLRDTAGPPSANILTTLTALATWHARDGNVSTALPILLSVLRARRSLPPPPPAATPVYDEPEAAVHASPWTVANVAGIAKRLLFPPSYPPPPADGHAPPVRDAQERCEEAGLNLYIGEIIYASSSHSSSSSSSHSSRSTREDGLAWTREAVDLAEEQLHKLNSDDEGGGGGASEAALRTCRECLASGLDNWRKMVARLARDEAERKGDPAKASGGGGWLAGLWGDGTPADARGRWAAEEDVVRERTRRAQEVLEESEAPKAGFGSLFWA